MNRTAFITIGGPALLTGILVGALASLLYSPHHDDANAPSRIPAPGARNPVGQSGPDSNSHLRPEQNELARLRQRVHDLEERLRSMPPTPDESRKAEEIYTQLSNPKIHADPKGWMRAIGQMADLRPTMSPIFVKKYREAKPRLDSVALELAIASGGQESVVLLKEILSGPSSQKAERVMAGIVLTGEGLLASMIPTVSADPELVTLAAGALALSDPWERQAGVGVLSLQPTDQARSALQTLVSQDKDEQVRIAALHALGRVGDRSTLGFLRSYASASFPNLSADDDVDEAKLPSVESTLFHTLHKLSQRFPE